MAKVKVMCDVEVKYLRARCGIRHWEDAIVNGVRDNDGTRIPCRTGENWCPTIDMDTGRIVDWLEGTTAYIRYKVGDNGDYALLDAGRNMVKSISGSVPDCMCPGGNGYGDYVIMTIGADGVIVGWVANLSDFNAKG